MIEPNKSTGYPDRRSFSSPMSSPLPNTPLVPQGLVPIPNLSRQHPLAPPQAHPQDPWAAGKNLNGTNQTGQKEKQISRIATEKQQQYLNLVHHLHHFQQQRQPDPDWIQLLQISVMNQQAFGEQAAGVSPTPSLEYHSSNFNAGSSPSNMQMMDHSTPTGYAYDSNSPASMQADSPASNDDVAFSSMFQVLGPQMTAPTGYETSQLQGYNGIKAEREDEMACFNASRNLATPGQGFEHHHPSPSTSPPESFVHWNHTPQASELNVGFLAPPHNPLTIAQGLHGFPSMPVLTANYTPRGMPSAIPNFTPSMEQGSTLGVAMNGNRSGSLDNFTMSAPQQRYQASIAAAANGSFATTADSPESMGSLYQGSFGDNYELSTSGQHFVMQARHGGSAIQSGCQPQLQQHHHARPNIVYPVGHSNMDSLEDHTALNNMSFGTNVPTWTHPSPTMATSTESLPRVTIPSLAQQHDNFTFLAQPGNVHGSSQGLHNERGGGGSIPKETKGSAQIPESKPRKPLPTSRSLAPKKDKRGRQSSRSPSPNPGRPASQASSSTQSRRPRKQAKRQRQANRDSSPSAAPQGQEVPVVRSRVNPTDKAHALALDETPTYHLQQHDNTPQPQLPALAPLPHTHTHTHTTTLPSSPVPAWSLFPIDNPKIADHVYTHHFPTATSGSTAAKSIIIGAGRITPSSIKMKYEDVKLIERRKKDEYIFHWKNEGWTYSQIKQVGGFTEAESTLRGRYRMITKEPEERVRKPKWTAVDVKLLERAVRLEASVPGGQGHGGNSRRRGKSAGCAQAQAQTNANTGGSGGGCLGESLFESPPSKSPVEGSAHPGTGAVEYYREDNDDGYSMPNFTTAPGNAGHGAGFIPYHDFEFESTLQEDQAQPPTRAEYLAMHNMTNTKPAQQADLSRPNVKIPWKRVSEEIVRMGGTYRFGPATCRKRWDALVHEHVVRKGKDINVEFYDWIWGDEVHEYFRGEQQEGDGEIDEDGDAEGEYEDEEGEYDGFEEEEEEGDK